ncbi:MAG: hypothetical protein AAFP90_22630, partial [Planctomycetota bacterium]
DAGAAQTRIGSATANKVWVNQQATTANEVYHSGSRIDQYIGDCQLKPGRNSVLIKTFQNAQTQPWAQVWDFQFRFTKPDGTPIRVEIVK